MMPPPYRPRRRWSTGKIVITILAVIGAIIVITVGGCFVVVLYAMYHG